MTGVRVLELFPELAGGLRGDALAGAREVTARSVAFEEGRLSLDHDPPDEAGALGLVVLEGLLLRRLEVLGSLVCTELLGPGDLLRPWNASAEEQGSIPAEAHWEAATAGRLALLDRRFALGAGRFPEVSSALLERAVERSRAMHFQLAVCHLTRVEDRILVTLWHLADRFGRVTPRGVTLPVPLPHRTLANLVGARRPSVTTALGALRQDGLVERTSTGWLLRGDPPEELGRLRRDSAVTPRTAPGR